MTKVVEHFYDTVSGETITVVYMDMALGIFGDTKKVRQESTFTIYINTRYDTATQLETLEHELEHIRNGDFEKEGSVQVIEAEAHHIELEQKPSKPEYRDERQRKAAERFMRAVRKHHKEVMKEYDEVARRNEILEHFGLEEVYVEGQPGCDGIPIVKTVRKKQKWE